MSESVALATLAKSDEQIDQLLRNLPEAVVSKLELTSDKVALLKAHLQGDGTLGLKERIPMVCRREDCEFHSNCVYHQTGLAQRDLPCLEEQVIIDKLVPAMIKNLSIDVEDAVELDMLAEYVDAELQEIRSQRQIAIKGQTHEVVTAVDQSTGIPYYETKESPLLSIKERAQKRKNQFRKDFLATREQRAKYKLKDEVDPSTEQSRKQKKYEELKKKYPDRFVNVEVVGGEADA